MSVAEQDSVTLSSFGFWPEEMWDPPCTQLPDEQQYIAEIEPSVEPMGICLSEIH
jgi:hypothetical protein